jgi:hypothetical protein
MRGLTKSVRDRIRSATLRTDRNLRCHRVDCQPNDGGDRKGHPMYDVAGGYAISRNRVVPYGVFVKVGSRRAAIPEGGTCRW